MRKFNKSTETEDLLDELLEGIEASSTVSMTEEEEEEKKIEEIIEQEEEDTFNPNGMAMVVERVEAGLIGSLRIKDKVNFPILKRGDLAQLRKPNRLLRRDFVLYKIDEDYFLRRIIKFKGLDIYVAGDNEHEYHIIHKENVVAKCIGRERGKTYASFGFNPQNKFYTFCKVNLAPIRLGRRITSYETDKNAEVLETAMQNLEFQAQKQESKVERVAPIITDIDLDSDLAAFLDPDQLVREFRGEVEKEEETEEVEEIEYVDEDGNVIEFVEETMEIVEESTEEAIEEEYEDEAEDEDDFEDEEDIEE